MFPIFLIKSRTVVSRFWVTWLKCDTKISDTLRHKKMVLARFQLSLENNKPTKSFLKKLRPSIFFIKIFFVNSQRLPSNPKIQAKTIHFAETLRTFTSAGKFCATSSQHRRSYQVITNERKVQHSHTIVVVVVVVFSCRTLLSKLGLENCL